MPKVDWEEAFAAIQQEVRTNNAEVKTRLAQIIDLLLDHLPLDMTTAAALLGAAVSAAETLLDKKISDELELANRLHQEPEKE